MIKKNNHIMQVDERMQKKTKKTLARERERRKITLQAKKTAA